MKISLEAPLLKWNIFEIYWQMLSFMHKLHVWHSCLLLHCVKSIKVISWFYLVAQPFFSVPLKLEQHSLVDDLRKTIGLYAKGQKDDTYNSRNFPIYFVNLILLFVFFFLHICLLVSVHFYQCACLRWAHCSAEQNSSARMRGSAFLWQFSTEKN